jgi:hypothetical protein
MAPTRRSARRLRAPYLPLGDLEEILVEVTGLLENAPRTPHVGTLDGRIVQCRTAIAACRRHEFSPPLLRALSAKVLELETDALVLRRALHMAKAPVHHEAEPQGKPRGQGDRTSRGRRRPPRSTH